MWNVRAYGRSGWRDVTDVIQLTGEWPTPEKLSDLVKSGFNGSGAKLLQHLEGERDADREMRKTGDLIGRQPIKDWASLAETQSAKFDWATGSKIVALDDEAIGLRPHGSASVSVIAWHEPTAVMMRMEPDDRELQVEYVPDAAADDRAARLRFRYADPKFELETILDWRAYFGSNTAIVDGSKEMYGNGRGFVTRLRADGGYLVGRLLRRLTFGSSSLEEDPLWRVRERKAAERFSHAAQRCPQLDARNVVEGQHAMVFVHGMTSCGLQGLKDLFPSSVTPRYPVRRFEHDTFLSITTNAEELVDLIQSSVRVKRLALVAH